jgi:hypothetical protein
VRKISAISEKHPFGIAQQGVPKMLGVDVFSRVASAFLESEAQLWVDRLRGYRLWPSYSVHRKAQRIG